jgi:hypothetical protein
MRKFIEGLLGKLDEEQRAALRQFFQRPPPLQGCRRTDAPLAALADLLQTVIPELVDLDQHAVELGKQFGLQR